MTLLNKLDEFLAANNKAAQESKQREIKVNKDGSFELAGFEFENLEDLAFELESYLARLRRRLRFDYFCDTYFDNETGHVDVHYYEDVGTWDLIEAVAGYHNKLKGMERVHACCTGYGRKLFGFYVVDESGKSQYYRFDDCLKNIPKFFVAS